MSNMVTAAYIHKYSIERIAKEQFESYWGVSIEAAIERANAEYEAQGEKNGL